MKHFPNAFSLVYSTARCRLTSSSKTCGKVSHFACSLASIYRPADRSTAIAGSSLGGAASPRRPRTKLSCGDSLCLQKLGAVAAQRLSCSSWFCTTAQAPAGSATTSSYRQQFIACCRFTLTERNPEVHESRNPEFFARFRVSPAVHRRIDWFSLS